MPVSMLTLELEISNAQSLKDRRQVLRSMRDTLRNRFNVSVAEMDEGVLWNRATLSIVAVNRSQTYLEHQLAEAENAVARVARRFGVDIVDSFADTLADAGSDHLDPTQSSVRMASKLQES